MLALLVSSVLAFAPPQAEAKPLGYVECSRCNPPRLVDGPCPLAIPTDAGHLPVVTILDNGEYRAGVYYDNSDGRCSKQYRPLRVVLGENGATIQHSEGAVPFGMAATLPQSRAVPIADEPLPPRVPTARGSWTLNLYFDPDLAAGLSPALIAAIDGALGKVINRIESLITIDAGGPVNVMVTMEERPGEVPGGTLFPETIPLAYSEVVSRLAAFADADSEAASEIVLYENLPLGSNLPVLINNLTPGTPVNRSTLTFTPSLARKLFFTSSDPLDALIVCDLSIGYDYDATNGIAAGAVDFEGVITHEVIHALGFQCAIDFANPGDPALEVWPMDLYRLDLDAGPSVTLTEFSTLPRILRYDVDAISALQTNTTVGIYPMASGVPPVGSGDQASHWKQASPPGINEIGIMAPGVLAGPTASTPMSPPDVLALDIVGWAIDSPLTHSAPEPAALLSPADQSFVSSLTPTLSWDPDPIAEHVYVSVFRRVAGVNHEMVFHEVDPVGTSIAIPSATLEESTEYSWNVVSENYMGYGFSPPRVFYTETPCPVDFDHNGSAGVADIFAFLSLWFGNDPSADFDNNTLIQVPDIFAFLAAWFAATC